VLIHGRLACLARSLSTVCVKLVQQIPTANAGTARKPRTGWPITAAYTRTSYSTRCNFYVESTSRLSESSRPSRMFSVDRLRCCCHLVFWLSLRAITWSDGASKRRRAFSSLRAESLLSLHVAKRDSCPKARHKHVVLRLPVVIPYYVARQTHRPIYWLACYWLALVCHWRVSQ